MNCTESRKLIELEIFEAPQDANDKLQQHLDQCAACRGYYETTERQRRLIRLLQERDPVPDDPGSLTEGIMSAIISPDRSGKSNTRTIRLAARLLAAASVLLFLTFGVEQYFVLEKMQLLEVTSGNLSTSGVYGLNSRDLRSVNTAGIQQFLQEYTMQNHGDRYLLARTADLGITDLRKYRELSHRLPHDNNRLKVLIKY